MMKTTHTESAANPSGYTQRNVASTAPVFRASSFRRFSAGTSLKLVQLKDRVAADLALEFGSVNSRLIRQVVNEADSLAATTPFPALLLPALAEEKVRTASQWAARQQLIRQQTLVLAA